MESRRGVFLSMVVPAYNEEEVIELFCERTVPVLSAIDPSFEIIFVNDGSRDKTAEKIGAANKKDPRIKLIELSRNFGKEIAVTAGLDFSTGEVVVVTDADLQDPPEVIPRMVELWNAGYDTVYATRGVREGETFFKKATARLFYRLIRQVTKIEIPENTGDFRLMSRRTVDALRLLREQHRFMKGLFSWVGFRQTSIIYNREPRVAGKTKWNYWKLWNLAIEGITSFSFAPLKIASYVGAVTAACAFSYAGYLIARTLILGRDIPGYASIMVTILFFSGAQLVFLGIIGEYLGRLFDESKRRPLYLVQNAVGIEADAGVIFSRRRSTRSTGAELSVPPFGEIQKRHERGEANCIHKISMLQGQSQEGDSFPSTPTEATSSSPWSSSTVPATPTRSTERSPTPPGTAGPSRT